MTSIKELDFQQSKAQLKAFLKTQEQYKDYDFEGSNLSVLLDVLAYNTYQNAFYGNMLFSEMFLDSAQLPNSVISHAKELNYLPRSIKAAKAVVTVNIYAPNNGANEFSIPKGTRFFGMRNGSQIIFTTRKPYTATRVSNSTRYEAKCIDIYQGMEVTETIHIGALYEPIPITNETIDTDTLTIRSSSGGVVQYYNRRDTIHGALSNDAVFYIEPSTDGRYSVVFGGNKYGKNPSNAEELAAIYAISDGAAANGVSEFTSPDIQGAVVTTISSASGGSDRETIDEIRFNAPKMYQTQDRAVTAEDYMILLKQRFSQISAISVYDGSNLNPPRHGRVAIAVNLKGDIYASDSFKSEVLNYLQDKIPVAISPVFVNPEFVYVHVDANLTYDYTRTRSTETDMRQLAMNSITSHNSLSEFGFTLRQSNITKLLDNIDTSILGSSISLKPMMEFSPEIGIVQNASFDFRAALRKPYPLDVTKPLSDYTPAIKSSTFTYGDANAFIQDDGNGVLKIFGVSATTSVVNILQQAAGFVDYETGLVRISSLIFDGYEGDAISITANIRDFDITSPKNRILVIRDKDVAINIKRAK